MKKALWVSLPILAGVSLLAAWAIIERSHPPDWQPAVAEYLDYQNARSAQAYTIRLSVRAEQPWNFTAEVNSLVYGSSQIFQTSVSYQDITVEPPQVIEDPARQPSDGRKPLPYPPEEVWCIWLATGPDAQPTVVFAALHSDLYNAEWVVHELPGAPPQELLTAIGCQPE